MISETWASPASPASPASFIDTNKSVPTIRSLYVVSAISYALVSFSVEMAGNRTSRTVVIHALGYQDVETSAVVGEVDHAHRPSAALGLGAAIAQLQAHLVTFFFFFFGGGGGLFFLV